MHAMVAWARILQQASAGSAPTNLVVPIYMRSMFLEGHCLGMDGDGIAA